MSPDASLLQPQFAGDPEDGFDIDEAGAGGIRLVLEDVSAHDNLDEGIDLDEEGTGDVVLLFEGVEASGNVDENIKVTEDEGTGLIRLEDSDVSGNADDDVNADGVIVVED